MGEKTKRSDSGEMGKKLTLGEASVEAFEVWKSSMSDDGYAPDDVPRAVKPEADLPGALA